MTWWLWFIAVYVVFGVVIGIRYWPTTDIAPPFELAVWKRLVDCILVGGSWLFEAIVLLWKEL